jgi:deoxyadenosine/deoxycytidine kinase
MSKIISVEGNIGSGKSTIVDVLKKYFENNSSNNIIFLQEPVDEWSEIKDKNGQTILSKFYENQKKYSFVFQMMAYISRLTLLKNTIKENPNAIIITERCLNTDRYVFAKMLYDSGNMEDVEYTVYLKWFDEFNELYNNQKMIYMKTDPAICFERIAKRDRDGETGIQLSYLEKCHQYHEDMINRFDKELVLVINSNIDTDKDDKILDIWINEIKKFI